MVDALPDGVVRDGRAARADRDAWKQHDASEFVAREDAPKFADGILVDQGAADPFLANQLNPDVFEAACVKAD